MTKPDTADAPIDLFDLAPISEANGLAMDDFWIWCPSVIQAEDGTWHMFASRWPAALPMHPGWLTHSEVIRATATDPTGPYTVAEVVLPARGPEHWDGRATHNPRIHAVDGRFYLFYTGITYPQDPPPLDRSLALDDPAVGAARASKRIGVAVADSLTGPWTRPDGPALDVAEGTFYSYLTSNPAPLRTAEGRDLLAFKSRATTADGGYGAMSLGMATAERPEGPYRVISDAPLFEDLGEFEDPFFWEASDGFHIIAKDMYGQVTGQRGGGAHFVSADALTWTLGTPAVAWRREVRFDDGRTVTFGNVERPSVLRAADGTITHLIGAVSDGTEGFHDASRTWNLVLPVVRQN